jgi:hypothetical protein
MIAKHLFLSVIFCSVICGCSSPPPPKPPPPPEPEPEKTEAPPAAVVQQELGSIDDGAIEGVFVKIGTDLEACHGAGRARVASLAGDVTVFLRIDATGKARYEYFQASTIGDRDTEKCILDLLARTTWPAPIGGEAEVTHGFGWEAGQERPPVAWESDKVISALDTSASTKHAIDQCKRGVSGSLQLTGYVSAGAPTPSVDPSQSTDPKKKGAKKHRKKTGKSKTKAVGHFRALGAATSSKDVAEKIDCVVGALKDLSLPSPGSATAKVSFTL